MIDAAQQQTFEKIGEYAFILAVGVYNAWQHRNGQKRTDRIEAKIDVDTSDLRKDLEAMHAIQERMMIKLNGGVDRRKARAATADNLAIAQEARRWKDFPNQGQPVTE